MTPFDQAVAQAPRDRVAVELEAMRCRNRVFPAGRSVPASACAIEARNTGRPVSRSPVGSETSDPRALVRELIREDILNDLARYGDRGQDGDDL